MILDGSEGSFVKGTLEPKGPTRQISVNEVGGEKSVVKILRRNKMDDLVGPSKKPLIRPKRKKRSGGSHMLDQTIPISPTLSKEVSRDFISQFSDPLKSRS